MKGGRVRGRGKSNASGTAYVFRVTNATLGRESNPPLAYASGLEVHHPIMSKLGDPGGRLDIYIYMQQPF